MEEDYFKNFQCNAILLYEYTNYYLGRVPLGPVDQWYARGIFYELGFWWAAKYYNQYNRKYAVHHANKGRSYLEGLYESATHVVERCWGYPALRERPINLVNVTHFAENTYLQFFYGVLNPGT